MVPIAFAGPIIVGNGAGEGEYSVVFVSAKLPSILEECGNVSCQLTSDEQKIFQALQAQASFPRTLVFKNSQSLGHNIFEIQGAEVWVNQDLLWRDSLQQIPFDVSDAGDLWIHVLASAAKLQSPLVDTIGQKISLSLSHETSRGRLDIENKGSVEFILWSRQSSDTLVIRDPALTILDLSDALKNAIHCPKPVSPRIFSPAWMSLVGGAAPTERLNLTLQFGMSWTCQGRSVVSRGLAAIQLVSEKGSAIFDPKSVYLYVEQ
jgi:hypothetical protein